jgi:soluble lytic murein transglycosylase-like protein
MKFRGKTFRTRPDPTPTPEARVEAPPAPAGSVTAIVYDAAAEFGLSGSYLASVAACESGLNPSAANPAGFYGLFQFDSSTWAAEGYGSIYDPVAQARTAARLLAAGHASRWPHCA